MKKIITVILAAALTASLSITAFAAGDMTGSSSAVTSAGSNDLAYTAIKQDYQTIVSLREQEKELYVSIKNDMEANKELAKSVGDELKSQLTTAKVAAQQAAGPLKDEITQLKQQAQSIVSQIAEAKQNKDTDALVALKEQFSEVTQQIKDDLAKIKESENVTEYTDLLSKLNVYTSQMNTLRAQIKSAQSDINTCQAKVDENWNSFKMAMSSKDYASADAALKDTISQKQRIIADLNTVAGLKQQVTALLNDMASELGVVVPVEKTTA